MSPNRRTRHQTTLVRELMARGAQLHSSLGGLRRCQNRVNDIRERCRVSDCDVPARSSRKDNRGGDAMRRAPIAYSHSHPRQYSEGWGMWLPSTPRGRSRRRSLRPTDEYRSRPRLPGRSGRDTGERDSESFRPCLDRTEDDRQSEPYARRSVVPFGVWGWNPSSGRWRREGSGIPKRDTASAPVGVWLGRLLGQRRELLDRKAG